MAIALILVAVGGLSFWFRGTAGADDAFIASPDAPWRPAPNGLPLSAEEMASALAAGDVVVAVNGRSMERWAVDLLDPALTRPAPPSGTRFRYTVERNHEQLVVAVELHPTPLLARLAGQWSTILLVVLLFVVAGIIFVARPDGPPTRAMLLVAALMACAAPSWILNLQVSDLVWGAGFWWWMTGQIATAFLYAALLHFALVLPARLPSDRSRPLLVTLAYLGPIVLHAAYLAMTLPGASGVLERVRLVGSCYVLTQFVYPVLVTVTLVIGYRATQDTVVRRQFRWLALTIAVGSLLHLVLFDLWDRAFGHALLPWSLHTLVFLPCPVAAAVAAIRYQAFQVHLVINRSLVWTSLTACIAAAYGTVLTLLATVLHGQVRPRLALTLAATGAIAVGLQPLQRRLQRALNRLMYGDRDDPYRVLARLGQQLESTVSPM